MPCIDRNGKTVVEVFFFRVFENGDLKDLKVKIAKFYDIIIKKSSNTKFKLSLWLYDSSDQDEENQAIRKTFFEKEFFMPKNEILLNLETLM